MWIAHLLLASTLKAYHNIIPDNLVGGDWGITQAGWQSRQDPAQHANGSEWAWIGVCCHLHCEALWRFFQVAPRFVPYNKRHTQTVVDSVPCSRRFRYPAMTSNILLTFMATIGAWRRLCAVLRSEPQQKRNQAVPKKKCRKQASQTWALVIYIYINLIIIIYTYLYYIPDIYTW